MNCLVSTALSKRAWVGGLTRTNTVIRTWDVLEEAIILGLPERERERERGRAWEIERERDREIEGAREK